MLYLFQNIEEKFLESGIFFPAGDGKLPWVPREEMGEAAAVVLTTPGYEHKTYAITANTAYSFEETAGMLSAITGKEVTYLIRCQLLKRPTANGSGGWIIFF